MARIDLHVHTRRYSPCAEFLPPEELGLAMRIAELTGIVLTEHDAFWDAHELEQLRAANPEFRIYCGVEITACDGHIIAIGVQSRFALNRALTMEVVAGQIAEVGGCAIWAHPFRAPRRWSHPPKTVHAVEVYSTVTFGRNSVESIHLAEALGVARVGGSDAHALDHLGRAGIDIEAAPENEEQLAALIRTGKAQPFFRQSPRL